MKKKIFVLIILIISTDVYSQQLEYKNEIVKSIIITSLKQKIFWSKADTNGVGHSSRVDNFTDKYFIEYNSNNENYFAIYAREHNRFIYKTIGEYRNKKNEKSIDYKDTLDQIVVKKFLNNLELNNLKANFNNSGMNYQEFIQLTNRKEILSVIKTKRIREQIEEDDLKKVRLDSIFNGVQSIDTFNLFLLNDFYFTKPYNKIHERPFESIEFNIKIITNKSTYEYIGGRLTSPYIQNWYNVKDSYSCILNFFINTSLIEILPQDFQAIETIGNKTLVDKYIEWYLKRRGVIPIQYYIDGL